LTSGGGASCPAPNIGEIMQVEEEYIEIDVETLFETDQAVKFTDGDREFWIPQSLMDDWPGVGESGTATVAEWFAEKEGLI